MSILNFISDLFVYVETIINNYLLPLSVITHIIKANETSFSLKCGWNKIRSWLILVG